MSAHHPSRYRTESSLHGLVVKDDRSRVVLEHGMSDFRLELFDYEVEELARELLEWLNKYEPRRLAALLEIIRDME